MSLFTVGHAMGNGQNVYLPPPEGQQTNVAGALYNSVYQRLPFAGQFWIGVAAWPAIIQYATTNTDPNAPPGPDAHPFLGTFQRRPTEAELNDLLRNTDKKPDLGWTYTVIAGVLNVLVIYDALAGAAFATPAPRPTPPGPLPENVPT